MNKVEQAIPCVGYELAADWYETGSDQTALVLPGYQSTKDRQEDLVAKVVLEAGMNALVLDYSGHGKSSLALDETRPAQHVLEVILTFDWLQHEKPNHKVAVIGSSYGGYLAAHLAQYRAFDKLLLRTPALYMPKDLYSLAPTIDREYTSNVYRQDAEEMAKHPLFNQDRMFDGSVLVVTHGEDTDVPSQTTDIYTTSFNAAHYTAESFQHSSHDKRNPSENYADYYATMARWLIQNEQQTIS